MEKLIQSIFDIQNEQDFAEVGLQIFHFQYNCVDVYRQFVDGVGRNNPKHYLEIPCLPISFFKTHYVATRDCVPTVVFQSSGTTGQVRSKHHVKDAQVYEESFTRAYKDLIGDPSNQIILALLPNYLEQGQSSLVYMVDHLVKQTNHPLSGFLLNQIDAIEQRYNEAIALDKEVVIFGVSYALLDLAERKINLSKAKIIETGGMKGRRKEMTKAELHTLLKAGLHVDYISSEYGMTELLSQGYSNRDGLFETPPWMKICIRDVNDPFQYLTNGKSGGINVFDLANLYSCSFIATDDLGKITHENFEILGRIDLSDIRGCNLLVQ